MADASKASSLLVRLAQWRVLHQGDSRAAIDAYGKALKLVPGLSKARDHYESLLHESGRTDELVDSISFRIEDAESPLDRAEYLCERAALHRSVDRMDAASRDLRAVLQIEPHHGRALDLELVYREKDDFRALSPFGNVSWAAGDKPDAVRLNRAIGHTLLRL